MTIERCAFCRRRVWRRPGGWISVTCKRHKNKPINWRFFRLPYVITNDEARFGNAEQPMEFERLTFKEGLPVVASPDYVPPEPIIIPCRKVNL